MSAGLKSNADGTSLYLQLNGVDVVEVTDTTLSVAGSTVLDTNVGLNADFLDGFDSSQFLRSDTSDTFTGNQLTLNQSLKVGSDIKIDAGGTDDSVVDYVSSIDSIKFGAIKPVVFGGSLSAPRWEPTAGGASYVMWNENNDGDGSGLDADKLDGFQGSQYLRSDVDDTFEANLTISGNLTVSGTTTTINTTNVTAEDAVITLNSGQSTPLNDIGLLFQRYATSDATNYNVGLAWDESADKFVIGKTPEDGADNDLTFNTEWFTIDDSGNSVVNGDFTVNGTLTETSSVALKDNVMPLKNPAEKLFNLNPVTYNRKGNPGVVEVGLVAEEVAEVFPELVSFDGEGYPVGVQYSKLSVLLLQVVKELLNGES